MSKSRSTYLLAALFGLFAFAGGGRAAKAAAPKKPSGGGGSNGGDGNGGDSDNGGSGDDSNGGGQEEGGPIDLDPYLNADPYWPMPETFYQVEQGDVFVGVNTDDEHAIVYSTLLSAAYTAAKEFGGLNDTDAASWALDVASDPNLRLDYLDLIYCSPWNDSLYGTYGYDVNFIGNFDSPAGRSFRLRRLHYDNYGRILAGEAPRRNIRLGTLSNKGNASGTAIDASQTSYEFLWLPGINLQTLWDTDGEVITTQGLSWEDGSTKLMPPPEVASLSAVDVPQGQWGC